MEQTQNFVTPRHPPRQLPFLTKLLHIVGGSNKIVANIILILILTVLALLPLTIVDIAAFLEFRGDMFQSKERFEAISLLFDNLVPIIIYGVTAIFILLISPPVIRSAIKNGFYLNKFLTHGKVVNGKLIDAKRIDFLHINNRPAYDLTMRFNADDGKEYEVTEIGFKDNYPGESGQIIYHPEAPDKAKILLGSFTRLISTDASGRLKTLSPKITFFSIILIVIRNLLLLVLFFSLLIYSAIIFNPSNILDHVPGISKWRPSLKIVSWGIYGAQKMKIRKKTPPAGESVVGIIGASNNPLLIEQTTNIRAKLGLQFGIQFMASGGDKGKVVPVLIRVKHPPIKNRNNDRFREIDQWEAKAQVGIPRFTGWIFEEKRELVAGEWEIQIVGKNKKLFSSKKFKISKTKR